MKITIGIADDHQLFMKSLAVLINTFPAFEVTVEALQGEDLLRKLAIVPVQPDIMLVDVNMPVLDGSKTVGRISREYPLIKAVALSMKDDDQSIIRMLKAGCCAYLLKDIHPDELEKALQEVYSKGFYNADAFNVNHRRLILGGQDGITLSDREQQFLQLACSDLTYKQIASEMYLAERTIDGYREALFEKLKVKSRVGMVLEAIRRNLVNL